MGEEIRPIEPDRLISAALNIKHDGYRLIQICATKTEDGYEITYSFGRAYNMVCLRMQVPPGAEIMSISKVYPPAFLYENEIQDLFGIRVNLMSLDYGGHLYRIEKKTPFQ